MIRAWARILVLDGLYKRTSYLHLKSSRTETETFSFYGTELRVDFISVWRWRYGSFSGKIIFISVAEVGGSSGPFMIIFVESLADSATMTIKARGFGEGIKHFAFGGIVGTVADFITVGGDD